MSNLGGRVFTDLLKREASQSLPPRTDKRRRNSGPLWAWIRGAKDGIAGVQTNETRFPFKAYNVAGKILFERLATRHKLTWIQKNWLLDLIAQKYPGRYESDYSILDDIDVKPRYRPQVVIHSREVEKFVDQRLQTALDGFTPPLRVILSPEVTIAINIKLMERILK